MDILRREITRINSQVSEDLILISPFLSLEIKKISKGKKRLEIKNDSFSSMKIYFRCVRKRILIS